jgi:hypothetical protein
MVVIVQGRTAGVASVLRDRGGSAAVPVELLQQMVSGELDHLVMPLRGAVHAGDQGRPVHAPEVTEDAALSLRV